MDALVLAGGDTHVDDPLYQYSQGKLKSLINLANKPITQWVLDALIESEHIKHIQLLGLEENSGLTSQKPTHFIPDQGDVLANVKKGFKEIKKVERMVGDRMGLQTEVVISPFAEIAMDIDKPHQLELLRVELEQGEGSGS